MIFLGSFPSSPLYFDAGTATDNYMTASASKVEAAGKGRRTDFRFSPFFRGRATFFKNVYTLYSMYIIHAVHYTLYMYNALLSYMFDRGYGEGYHLAHSGVATVTHPGLVIVIHPCFLLGLI